MLTNLKTSYKGKKSTYCTLSPEISCLVQLVQFLICQCAKGAMFIKSTDSLKGFFTSCLFFKTRKYLILLLRCVLTLHRTQNSIIYLTTIFSVIKKIIVINFFLLQAITEKILSSIILASIIQKYLQRQAILFKICHKFQKSLRINCFEIDKTISI